MSWNSLARLKVWTASLFALALHAGSAWGTVITVPIERYVLSQGSSNKYFDGKLLTAGDLGSDQDYLRHTHRYLGLSDLPLSVLFARVSLADVTLDLDDAQLTVNNFSAPKDAASPQLDDLIILDNGGHRWRGRLFLAGINGSAGGVYDDLVGDFSSLRQVPEPDTRTLFALALVAGVARTRFRRTGTKAV